MESKWCHKVWNIAVFLYVSYASIQWNFDTTDTTPWPYVGKTYIILIFQAFNFFFKINRFLYSETYIFPYPSTHCFLFSSSSLLEMFGLTSKEKNMSTPEHLCPHRVLWWQWYTPFTSVTLSWTLMLSAFKDLTPQGKRIQVKNVDLCLTHSLLQEHLAAICSRVKNQTHKVLQSSEPCLHNHIQNKY